ncbi:MAG: hypothetical protein HN396_14645 [Gemmatimonadales bacterium]|jgi:hypothetical protein|nr:hypothetical protein [Gemmatimonadales bacterium]
MPIWRVTDDGPQQLPGTEFGAENVLEADIEGWIAGDPLFLMEPLLIIGRQVDVHGVRDKLDLLALDTKGKAVIIELKRGALDDPVDMQALRYASYISRWRYADLEAAARSLPTAGEGYSLNEAYEEFCSDAGLDESPDINNDQRIMIVGSEVKDRLGSVALWLREHSVDITLIEIDCFADQDCGLLLAPNVLVPHPVSRFGDLGKGPDSDGSKPWLTDGRAWHVEKRCSRDTARVLLEIDALVRDTVETDEPSWEQKLYVTYRIRGYTWLNVGTHSRLISLDLLVKDGVFTTEDVAQRLDLHQFDSDATAAEKHSWPSSVVVTSRTGNSDKVTLRLKEDFDVGAEAFASFIGAAHDAFYR